MTFLSESALHFTPFFTGFTMTTHHHTTTMTTTTIVASPIVNEIKSAAARRNSAHTAVAVFTPPFFPQVYAGNKRLSVCVSEQPAKRPRRRGSFRPRVHPYTSGPRKLIFTSETRYNLPPSCIVGKRQRIIKVEEAEKGLKARVLKNGRLHFMTNGEETFEEALERLDSGASQEENEEKGHLTPQSTSTMPRLPICLRPNSRKVSHLDIRKSEPIHSIRGEALSIELVVPGVQSPSGAKDLGGEEERENSKTPKRAILSPIKSSPLSSPTKSVDDHAHDDCPTEDDEPKKSKEKSVLSKIGSLQSFKNAVARAGSRVKKWKQRKEKKDEKKKKIADEKKSVKEIKTRGKKAKDDHDSGADTDDDSKLPKRASDKDKDNSLRSSLRFRSSRKPKSHIRDVFKLPSDEESEDETEARQRRRGPTRSPSPKPQADTEMKDSTRDRDIESDGPEAEKPKKMKKRISRRSGNKKEETEEKAESGASKDKEETSDRKDKEETSDKKDKEETSDRKDKEEKEKRQKEDEEDEEDEKEEEKSRKKRLSPSLIEAKKSPEVEDSEDKSDSSTASINDVDMLLDGKEHEENLETRSIASTSLQDMDLDDNKAIRGDDGKCKDEINAVTNGSENPESDPKKTNEIGDDGSKEPEGQEDDDDAETATIKPSNIEIDQESGFASKGAEEEEPSNKDEDDGNKANDSQTSLSSRHPALAVLPPSDVLTPPPTPPHGRSTQSVSHWISWRANISSTEVDSDRSWSRSSLGKKKSLRRRLSAIFKKTLEDNGVDRFNPLNISRHAYRDSFCRDDDEETECDSTSVYKLPLTASSPSAVMDFCAWDTFEPGPVDSCLERLEGFTMAC